MAIDMRVPSSRRALLAGGIGGLAAVTAAAARPITVAAGSDGDVVLGAINDATSTTFIRNETNSNNVLACIGNGHGLYGYSHQKAGILGESKVEDGVVGRAVVANKSGVYGQTTSKDGFGVYGNNAGNGNLGSIGGWAAGVAGYSPAGFGVFGGSKTGYGVYGQSLDAGTIAVFGQSGAGVGVRGDATTGTAVYARSGDPAKGFALRARGRVKLDQCAGLTTISAGSKARTVTPGIALVDTSAVVATLQGNPGSATTAVARVLVNATANTFTIYLTANATQTVKVAWHVFG